MLVMLRARQQLGEKTEDGKHEGSEKERKMTVRRAVRVREVVGQKDGNQGRGRTVLSKEISRGGVIVCI